MMRSVTGKDKEEDEIDQILSRGDEILPSSGFAASVMDAVRREAAAPAPIPFPWMRALPGLVVGACALLVALVAGVAAIARMSRDSIAPPGYAPPEIPSLFHGGIQSAVIWTMLALLLAFVSVKVSTRAT
jgi:hypothetical protein